MLKRSSLMDLPNTTMIRVDQSGTSSTFAATSLLDERVPRVRVTIRARETLTPSWIVEDHAGRRLGAVTQAAGFGFLIHAAHGTQLRGVDFGPHNTLKEAAQAIGTHLHTTCVIER